MNFRYRFPCKQSLIKKEELYFIISPRKLVDKNINEFILADGNERFGRPMRKLLRICLWAVEQGPPNT